MGLQGPIPLQSLTKAKERREREKAKVARAKEVDQQMALETMLQLLPNDDG